MLTDCLEACQNNESCSAVNYETGLCVLFSTTADKLPGNIQFFYLVLCFIYYLITVGLLLEKVKVMEECKRGVPSAIWICFCSDHFENFVGFIMKSPVAALTLDER